MPFILQDFRFSFFFLSRFLSAASRTALDDFPRDINVKETKEREITRCHSHTNYVVGIRRSFQESSAFAVSCIVSGNVERIFAKAGN